MSFDLLFSFLLFIVFLAYVLMIAAFSYYLIKLSGSSSDRFKGSLFSHINPSNPGNSAVKVSVIIPVRNEAATIIKCLEGMVAQDYPAFEVIVSDDFSDDYTLELVHRFAKKNMDFPLITVEGMPHRPELSGKKRAIERAIEKASGTWILTTDADTLHGVHWISAFLALIGSTNCQMVLAPVAFHREKTFLQKIQTLEFLGLMGVTAGSARMGYPVMCNGANMAYRRDAFLSVGGYSGNAQHFSGDDQFLLGAILSKFGKGSVRFLWDEKAVVVTEPERSWDGFLSQRIRWVSKSRGYREPAVMTVSILTYLIHFFLLSGFVFGLFFPLILILTSSMWLGKILVEYPMVYLMARFLKKNEFLGYYFVAQVFQLFYIVTIGALGQLLPYKWKGRKRVRWPKSDRREG